MHARLRVGVVGVAFQHPLHAGEGGQRVLRDAAEIEPGLGVAAVGGYGLDEELMDRMIRQGTYWCPTIYVGVYVAEGRAAAGAPIWLEMRDLEAKAFAVAVRKGVKIAYGTDAGGFAWTVNEAKEFNYMVRYGMTPMQAIQSATLTAADLLERSADMGAIEAGKYADIVATTGDPLKDITELERIRFVMKGGEIVRNEIGR